MSLLKIFKEHSHLLDKPVTVEMVNDIEYYLEHKWYLQILKEFGIVIVLLLIEYHIKVEDYMVCDKLKTAIDDSNTHFGTTYGYTLDEYGNMS